MVDISKGFNVEWIKFSAGEHQCKVTIEPDNGFIKHPTITCNWKGAEDTEKICLLKNALDNIGYGKFAKLNIPYMPYSRQDRITEHGASFALKVFANVINSLEFKEVITLDVHSQATELLINNLTNKDQSEWLTEILIGEPTIDCIIAPDAGAYKKVYETCSKLPQTIKDRIEVVCAQKVRNVSTGEIEGMEIDQVKVAGKNILVLDDICDGGRTFIELAKILPLPIEMMQLAVSHGIFSRGREVLGKYYCRIHTLNNMEKK